MNHNHQILDELRGPTKPLRHAKAASRAGATQREIAELLGVAPLMDGGTSNVYAPRAWEAFLEFAADAAPVALAGV
jgi:alkylhydroperoxidase/carboxymuconolactone decarboxylase family protein YurZ